MVTTPPTGSPGNASTGRLEVRVQPGARRTAFVGWFGAIPKLAVTSPPVDGRANDEVVEAVARLLDVPVRHVRLVGGLRSRTKRLEVTGVDTATITERVERAAGPRPRR